MVAEESLLLGGMQTLRELGFFDFFLPFILFFAIIYGALDKTNVFGEGRKDINAVIALVISLIAATTGWVLKGVTGFLPWVGFTALVIISFLMLAGMIVGGDLEELFKSKVVKWGGVLVVALVLFFAVYYSLGFDKAIAASGGIGISETDVALIVLILVGIGAFIGITKGGGSSKSD